MNKVFLIGNLTRDPELTETSGGVSICRFSIAVSRNYNGPDGERKTDFFNVTAWRSLGETIARYAHKGNKLAVTGSIELRSYEDSQGVKRTAVDIIAQDVEFLTPKSSNSDYDDEVGHDVPRTKPGNYSALPRQQSMYDKKPTLQSFDEDGDIPF